MQHNAISSSKILKSSLIFLSGLKKNTNVTLIDLSPSYNGLNEELKSHVCTYGT